MHSVALLLGVACLLLAQAATGEERVESNLQLHASEQTETETGATLAMAARLRSATWREEDPVEVWSNFLRFRQKQRNLEHLSPPTVRIVDCSGKNSDFVWAKIKPPKCVHIRHRWRDHLAKPEFDGEYDVDPYEGLDLTDYNSFMYSLKREMQKNPKRNCTNFHPARPTPASCCGDGFLCPFDDGQCCPSGLACCPGGSECITRGMGVPEACRFGQAELPKPCVCPPPCNERDRSKCPPRPKCCAPEQHQLAAMEGLSRNDLPRPRRLDDDGSGVDDESCTCGQEAQCNYEQDEHEENGEIVIRPGVYKSVCKNLPCACQALRRVRPWLFQGFPPAPGQATAEVHRNRKNFRHRSSRGGGGGRGYAGRGHRWHKQARDGRRRRHRHVKDVTADPSVVDALVQTGHTVTRRTVEQFQQGTLPPSPPKSGSSSSSSSAPTSDVVDDTVDDDDDDDADPFSDAASAKKDPPAASDMSSASMGPESRLTAERDDEDAQKDNAKWEAYVRLREVAIKKRKAEKESFKKKKKANKEGFDKRQQEREEKFRAMASSLANEESEKRNGDIINENKSKAARKRLMEEAKKTALAQEKAMKSIYSVKPDAVKYPYKKGSDDEQDATMAANLDYKQTSDETTIKEIYLNPNEPQKQKLAELTRLFGGTLPPEFENNKLPQTDRPPDIEDDTVKPQSAFGSLFGSAAATAAANAAVQKKNATSDTPVSKSTGRAPSTKNSQDKQQDKQSQQQQERRLVNEPTAKGAGAGGAMNSSSIEQQILEEEKQKAQKLAIRIKQLESEKKAQKASSSKHVVGDFLEVSGVVVPSTASEDVVVPQPNQVNRLLANVLHIPLESLQPESVQTTPLPAGESSVAIPPPIEIPASSAHSMRFQVPTPTDRVSNVTSTASAPLDQLATALGARHVVLNLRLIVPEAAVPEMARDAIVPAAVEVSNGTGTENSPEWQKAKEDVQGKLQSFCVVRSTTGVMKSNVLMGTCAENQRNIETLSVNSAGEKFAPYVQFDALRGPLLPNAVPYCVRSLSRSSVVVPNSNSCSEGLWQQTAIFYGFSDYYPTSNLLCVASASAQVDDQPKRSYFYPDQEECGSSRWSKDFHVYVFNVKDLLQDAASN